MSLTVYAVSAALVLVFSGLLAMAGLGAAFLFVPLFYYLGVPLAEAAPAPMLPHAFDTIICAECGEMAVERYARVRHGKIVCMPCAEKVESV